MSFGNLRSTVCLLPKLSEILLITTREDYGSACFLLRVSFRCRSGPNSSTRWSITLKGTPVVSRKNVWPPRAPLSGNRCSPGHPPSRPDQLNAFRWDLQLARLPGLVQLHWTESAAAAVGKP